MDTLNNLFTTEDQKQVQAYTQKVSDLQIQYAAVASSDVSQQSIELNAIFRAMRDTEATFGLFKQFVSDVERLGGVDILDPGEFEAYRKASREAAEDVTSDLKDIQDGYHERRAEARIGYADIQRYQARYRESSELERIDMKNLGFGYADLREKSSKFSEKSAVAIEAVKEEWKDFGDRFEDIIGSANTILGTQGDKLLDLRKIYRRNGDELIEMSGHTFDWASNEEKLISEWSEGFQKAFNLSQEEAEAFSQILFDQQVITAEFAREQSNYHQTIRYQVNATKEAAIEMGWGFEEAHSVANAALQSTEDSSTNYQHTLEETSRSVQTHIEHVEKQKKWLDSAAFAYKQMIEQTNVEPNLSPLDNYVTKLGYVTSAGIAAQASIIATGAAAQIAYRMSKLEGTEGPIDTSFIDMILANVDSTAKKLAGNTFDTGGWYDTIYNRFMQKAGGKVIGGVTDSDVKQAISSGGGGGGLTKEQQRVSLLTEMKRMYESKDMKFDEESTDVQDALAAFEQDYANQETDDYTQMEYDTGFRSRTDKVLDRIGRGIDADVKFSLNIKQKSHSNATAC